MPHIFISYAKKDTRSLAIQLADALNAIEGVSAWVDRSLRAGQSWEVQIQTEIDRCDAMVVLYSPDINRHKQGQEQSYVLNEIAYAMRIARKPIIPVMVQLTEPPISLVTAHYIDFTLDGLTLDDLVQALCDEVGVAYSANLITPSLREIAPGLRVFHIPSFEWIEIPGGHGTMKTSDSSVMLTIPPQKYWISEYPVINAQYARFIEAGGYQQKKWWTQAGWRQREKDKWTEPLFWNDSQWNGAEHPVVGVSWYEAMAFCLWLSDITGEKILLPAEAQWQYAAQGNDGREYPWGDTFDKNRCNTLESGILKTTSVRQYEGKGDSPFGVVDMAGNVWEWCLTDYDNPQVDAARENIHADARRVLRGGSWNFDRSIARAACRSYDNPSYRVSFFGFRLCRAGG